jgi:hypothetical protein
MQTIFRAYFDQILKKVLILISVQIRINLTLEIICRGFGIYLSYDLPIYGFCFTDFLAG